MAGFRVRNQGLLGSSQRVILLALNPFADGGYFRQNNYLKKIDGNPGTLVLI